MFSNMMSIILLLFASLAYARGDIWRPCEMDSSEDAVNDCISKHFVANSNCSPDVAGVFPTFFMIPYIRSQATSNNITETRYNTVVSSKGGKSWVEDLFIDETTDHLYMTVNYDNFWGTGEAHYTYHSLGKPDRTIVSVSYEKYPNIKVTIKIPTSKNLDFKNMETSAYLSELPSEFDLGEGFKKAANRDPDFYHLMESIMKDLTPHVQEVFFERSAILAKQYINNVICKIV